MSFSTTILVLFEGHSVLGRGFCFAVFFVLCWSIFETIATESCIGTQLCFSEMGYASVSPSMWYLVKLIVSAASPALCLMQLEQYKLGKGRVIRPLCNSGTNRSWVCCNCHSFKMAVLKLNHALRFRQWGFALFFVYCDSIFDIVGNVSLLGFEDKRFVHRFQMFFFGFYICLDLYYHFRKLFLASLLSWCKYYVIHVFHKHW